MQCIILSISPTAPLAPGCVPCSGVLCPHARRVCPGGHVTEPCGCCPQCARQMGQVCGGPHWEKGYCDRDLTCTLFTGRSPARPPHTGVCKGKRIGSNRWGLRGHIEVRPLYKFKHCVTATVMKVVHGCVLCNSLRLLMGDCVCLPITYLNYIFIIITYLCINLFYLYIVRTERWCRGRGVSLLTPGL